MNQKYAMQETIQLALSRGYDDISFEQEGVDYAHITSMYSRVTSDFSEAKLGRWLGYIQGVLVPNAIITLEEAKEINKRWAD